MAAGSNSARSSILFHIAGVFLPPFFLVPTLLAIDSVRGDFLSMVISAASLLALCGIANPLIRVVSARTEFLFAIGATCFSCLRLARKNGAATGKSIAFGEIGGREAKLDG